MASSHVVVIDSSARRATIKVTPNKHLSEVVEEACGKLGLTASQYGLRNNNKPVDLSRTIRLSGLSSGAKLELVQLSKSAGVVSVALQLPESEAVGAPNGRLMDKFPSTTTLWQVLRKFEAGVAGGGGGRSRNLTARAAPGANEGNVGAGRLYYQTPVVQVMGRELSSFTDLQKSLAQLGFNSGSTLLRLNFRTSEVPLEEAMAQIDAYFRSVDGPASEQSSTAIPPPTQSRAPEPEASEPTAASAEDPDSNFSPPETMIASTTAPLSPSSRQNTTNTPPFSNTSGPRSVTVFRPPTSHVPAAALASHNPADYTPTIEHAQSHQRMLSQSSRNVRLPTEAEIAAQTAQEQEKLAAIKEVEIKIRFPDESAVSAKFGQPDRGADLYKFVRDECLESRWRGEGFLLRSPGVGVMGKGSKEVIIPDDATKGLIADLGFKGRVLVIFEWDDDKASLAARSVKSVLRAELRRQAKDVEVVEIKGENSDDDGDVGGRGVRVNLGVDTSGTSDQSKKKGGMPKWLGKLSKK